MATLTAVKNSRSGNKPQVPTLDAPRVPWKWEPPLGESVAPCSISRSPGEIHPLNLPAKPND